jgi:hypothetical protein
MDLYAEDAVVHYPGRNRLSGEHKGRDAIRAFLETAMELTRGTLRPEIHDVLADDEHVALLVELSADRDGKRFAWAAVDVYHVRDGVIQEHWVAESNQYVVDELFS